ncbi:hypothetical protein T02_5403 [Trichinella nativa]|uniref:Uncharacterized protein n=1 Tax=Trichinella nativa TaxID=6335 RepID=A0A0V1L0B3_9BILA|nr:hypothetical protein T02_5403 [Trichinella nativa]
MLFNDGCEPAVKSTSSVDKPSLSSLPSVSSIFRDDRLWFACQASVSGHQNFLEYHPFWRLAFRAALTFDLALFVQDQLASTTSGPTLRVANQQVRRLIRGVPQCSLRAYCPSSR